MHPAIALLLMLPAVLDTDDDTPALKPLETQVCVVGGGSGGFASALAAARAGVDVVLVEQLGGLGGTSTAGYVSAWEPGPGESFARELYDRLDALEAVGISRDRNPSRKLGPFGLWLLDPEATYEQTLGRAGKGRPEWRAAVFDPEVMALEMAALLDQTGRCQLLLRTKFLQAEVEGRRVTAALARGEDGQLWRITADVFIDATGDAFLCRSAGCRTLLGAEPKSRFNEPSAPDQAEMVLNAISLCYRVRPSDTPKRQPAPEPPVPHWPHTAHVGEMPGGDLIINPLPMLPGTALIELGYDEAMARCRRIVRAHWNWLQGYETFAGYEFVDTAEKLGVRESYRVECRYMLTEHDVRGGLSAQDHPDIIATADHSLDVHGRGSRRVHGEVTEAYGIPYRCLVPKATDNVLIACRGAGFSHIAASSCRLNRTILSLGHAAGQAAARAVLDEIPVTQINRLERRKKELLDELDDAG